VLEGRPGRGRRRQRRGKNEALWVPRKMEHQLHKNS